MFGQIGLLLLSLFLIIVSCWSLGEFIRAIRERGFYPSGTKRMPERIGWWFKGASFVAAGAVSYYMSTVLVDPYTWYVFFVIVAVVIWIGLSTVLIRFICWQYPYNPVWQKIIWSVVASVIIGGIITSIFNGVTALFNTLKIVAGLMLLSQINYHWRMKNIISKYWPPYDYGTRLIISIAIALSFIVMMVSVIWIENGFRGLYGNITHSKAAKFVKRATSPPVVKPSPKQKDMLPKTITGKGVWVFCLDAISRKENGLSKVVEKAKKYEADCMFIKAFDSDLHNHFPKSGDWMPWNENGEDVRPYLKKIVGLAHNEGIKVYAWGFVWGDDPEYEAKLVIESLELGVDGFFYDVEDQYAGQVKSAEIMCLIVSEYVKKKNPNLLIGFTSYDNPNWHKSRVPFKVFDKYCDVFAPQTYWKDDSWGIPRERVGWAFNSWVDYQEKVLKPAGGGKSFDNIIPIGHGYDSRLSPPGQHLADIPYDEIVNFMKEVDGYWGVQLWVWDYMGPAQWQAFRDGPGGLEEKIVRYNKLKKK